MLACMIALLVREKTKDGTTESRAIALIYRDLCFWMERFYQHLEAFANEKNNPIFCRFADFA